MQSKLCPGVEVLAETCHVRPINGQNIVVAEVVQDKKDSFKAWELAWARTPAYASTIGLEGIANMWFTARCNTNDDKGILAARAEVALAFDRYWGAFVKEGE